MESLEHNALGTVLAPVKSLLKKETLMSAAKLGVGAAGGIAGMSFLLDKVLVRNGVPLVPLKWNPLAMAVGGVVGSGLVRRFVGEKIAVGIVAGTVGAAVVSVAQAFMSRRAAATVEAAAQAEAQGAGPQPVEGFGFGRLFAGGRQLALSGGQVYGVGTPDMSAAQMFNGATVAIEETGGMAGAAVAIEESSPFAGILS